MRDFVISQLLKSSIRCIMNEVWGEVLLLGCRAIGTNSVGSLNWSLLYRCTATRFVPYWAASCAGSGTVCFRERHDEECVESVPLQPKYLF